MKRICLATLVLFVLGKANAQNEVSRDKDGIKVVRGFLTERELATDTSYASWFAPNQKGYVPDQGALDALRKNRDSINIIAFGGTWCSDTYFILPKFFQLTDAAGFPQDRLTVVGVDHNKKTIQHLSEVFNVTHVPTIIVMKNGRELGRVVEYGEHGMFDRELGEIIAGKTE
jgi:thiol-disulfide isomerase/thioredoxin